MRFLRINPLGLSGAVALGVITAGVAVAAVVTGVAAQGKGQSSAHSSEATPAACPTPQQIQAQLEQAQHQFAARLATALGKPLSDVEQALKRAEPPAGAPSTVSRYTSATSFDDTNSLAPAAAKLGVTTAELAAAMKAAAPEPVLKNVTFCTVAIGRNVALSSGAIGFSPIAVGGTAGVMVQPPFEAIAQKLGHGITADQVRDALATLAPPAPPAPDPVIQAQEAARLEALATALNVTVDQLKAALQNVNAQGCPGFPSTGQAGGIMVGAAPTGTVACVFVGIPGIP